MSSKAKKGRTNEIFGEIMSGLADTAAYLDGAKKGFRVHIPETIDVKAIRKSRKMSQGAFAEHYGFSDARVKDWEQGRTSPDQAMRAYLLVIDKEPEVVEKILSEAAA